MSLKAQITGQFNLVNESSNVNFLSFDLAELFGAITGVKEQTFVERELIDTDGAVAIDLGGVTTVKGIMIAVIGSGVVTMKHDSNTNGIDISSGLILFGELGVITLETPATQALTVKYLVFE